MPEVAGGEREQQFDGDDWEEEGELNMLGKGGEDVNREDAQEVFSRHR